MASADAPDLDAREAFLAPMNPDQLMTLLMDLPQDLWRAMLGRRIEKCSTAGDLAGAKSLAAAGADMGEGLHCAIHWGHLGVVETLMGANANPNAKSRGGNCPLHTAVLSKTPNTRIIVEVLLACEGISVDSTDIHGRTPLYLAVKGKKHDRFENKIVDALLVAGADPNATCGDLGRTPMHAAHRKPSTMCKLWETGADPDAKDGDGKAPIHYAAAKYGESVEQLWILGASLDARANDGTTALHMAASGGVLHSVNCLIWGGADVNARTNKGGTPLHFAARKSSSLEILEALLRAGADEKLVDVTGRAPVDVIPSPVSEVTERIRAKLAAAPADRAWRRRGVLAMLRRTGALQAREDTERGKRAQNRRSHRRRMDGDWAGGVEWLVTETPVEVFRLVVSFL